MEIDFSIPQNQFKEIINILRKLKTFSMETFLHSINTADICLTIANKLNFSPAQKQNLYVGALIHDCGKLSIDKELLHSRNITESEKQTIKKHAIESYFMVKDNFPYEVSEMVRDHHEKPNGQGYPHHLIDEDISQLTKILAVSDVASALLLKRSYKPALQTHQVADILSEKAMKGDLDSFYVKVAIEEYVNNFTSEDTEETVLPTIPNVFDRHFPSDKNDFPCQ